MGGGLLSGEIHQADMLRTTATCPSQEDSQQEDHLLARYTGCQIESNITQKDTYFLPGGQTIHKFSIHQI